MENSVIQKSNAEADRNIANNLMPAKSQLRYEHVYKIFIEWQNENKFSSFSEDILIVYFDEKAKKLKPSSLWSIYSMLRVTIKLNHNIDIADYTKLRGMLKAKGAGFVSKKSLTFTAAEMAKFLNTAPDWKYLDTKVVIIFGTSGACRNAELSIMKFSYVKLRGDAYSVDIPSTKISPARRFYIHEKFTPIVQKYMNLRPPDCTSDRFFLNYQSEKCSNQPIGKNKFLKMPKIIAQFLGLRNAEKYTVHAFRRSSANLLAESGADIAEIQRHRGWKSTQMAQGYVDKSDALKNSAAQQTSEVIDLSTIEEMPNVSVDAEQNNDANPDFEQFNAEQKQSEAEQKEAEAKQKEAEAEQKEAEAEQKESAAEQEKSEAEQKNSEAEQKNSEAEQKNSEAEQENYSNFHFQPKPIYEKHYHFHNCNIYFQRPL